MSPCGYSYYTPLIFQLRKKRISFVSRLEKRILAVHEHYTTISRSLIQEPKLKKGPKTFLDPYDIVSTNISDYYEFDIKLAKMGWKIVKIMNDNHGFLCFQQITLQPLMNYKNQKNIQAKSTMDFQQNKKKRGFFTESAATV